MGLRTLKTLRRTGIIILAVSILFGPGLVQVLDVDAPQIRSWRMYSGVGLGAPYGSFDVLNSGEPVRSVSVVAAMEIDSIRGIQAYTGSGSLRRGFDADVVIREAGEPLCATLAPDESIRFSGRLAARGGWRPLTYSHDDLCGAL